MRAPNSPRWKLAEQAANRLTAMYDRPPIPVIEIAESNGVDVVFADFGPNRDKVAGFCDFANSRLYVNSSDTVSRQAFTMAHELGHWVLHREIFLADPTSYPVLPRFQAPNNGDPLEKEANKFAAILLVPSRLLKPVSGAPVASLARAFGVSQTMMEFRIKNG